MHDHLNHDGVGDACQTLGVGDEPLPGRVMLGRLAPNPVSSALNYTITVPRPMHVAVSVYDVRGRLVARVLDQSLPAGEHSFAWNAWRAGIQTGSYYLRLNAIGVEQTRKFSVIR